jgi:hypothetical protein
MSCTSSQHQGGLVILIECRIGVFMASFEKHSADIAVAEGSGQV